MYVQRRAFLRFRATVIKIQRVMRLRYCVVRVRRRHRAAAQLLLDFLLATGGTRQAAAMDLREIHSNCEATGGAGEGIYMHVSPRGQGVPFMCPPPSGRG